MGESTGAGGVKILTPSDAERQNGAGKAGETRNRPWGWISVKRLLIIGLGFLILILGIVMIFLPGPGILFILLGLGILARELKWARNILIKVRNRIRRKKENQQATSPPPSNPTV